MPEERINKRELLGALEIAKPALASNSSFAIQMRHFWFNDNYVSAYDGRIGIFASIETAIRGGVPPALHSWLEKIDGEEAVISVNDDELVIKVGNSKASFPILPPSSQVLLPSPDLISDESVDVSADLMRNLKNVLISLDKKSATPSRMGAFFIPDGDVLDIYSTDAATMCWVHTAKPRGFFDKTIVVPTGFLEQLISIIPGGGDDCLFLHDNIIVASNHLRGTLLLGNLIDCPNIPNFNSVINREKVTDEGVIIPEGFGKALDRISVSSAKISEFYIDGEILTINSRSDKTSIQEKIALPGHDRVFSQYDIGYVKRALPDRTSIKFGEKSVVLKGPEEFTHIISCCG